MSSGGSTGAMRAPDTWGSRAVKAGFLIAVLGAWYYLTENAVVNRVILPHPANVVRDLQKVVVSHAFFVDLTTTLFEIAVAFGIALVFGIVLGYAISRTQARIREFEPLLAALFAIPIVMFYPLFVLMFGIGPPSKIAVGTTVGFFPIVLATIAGFGSVNKVLISAARTMGANDAQLLRWVLLPSALPVIATGLRMGLILTMLTVLGSETLGSRVGLGYQMIALTEEMETSKTYAYIVIIIVVATLLNIVASLIEKALQTRREDS